MLDLSFPLHKYVYISKNILDFLFKKQSLIPYEPYHVRSQGPLKIKLSPFLSLPSMAWLIVQP